MKAWYFVRAYRALSRLHSLVSSVRVMLCLVVFVSTRLVLPFRASSLNLLVLYCMYCIVLCCMYCMYDCIVLYCIVSPCRVLSRFVISCHILSHLVISCHILSCLAFIHVQFRCSACGCVQLVYPSKEKEKLADMSVRPAHFLSLSLAVASRPHRERMDEPRHLSISS